MRSAFLVLFLMLFPVLAEANPRQRVSQPDTTVLNSRNTVVLRGVVTDNSISKVIRQINESTEPELYLFLSSPGGSIMAGNQLVYLLQTTDKKITCVANIAASMAFVILQACERRVVLPHATVMQHVASYGLRGEAPNNLSRVRFLHRMIDEMDRWQARRIGMSLREFKARTRSDWWLFGRESIRANVADSTGAFRCSPEMTRARVKEKVQVFIFTIDVEWSACPLVEYPVKIGDTDTLARISQVPEASKELGNLLNGYRIRNNMMEWFQTGKSPYKFEL